MDASVIPFFDREGSKEIFGYQCIQCKLDEMIEQGLRGPSRMKGGCFCKVIERDCPFVLTSKPGKNRSLCVAPSSYYFKPFGFNLLKENSTYIIGKSHFMFYMYHPAAGWMPPQEKPKKNRFGKLINWEKDFWTLAHGNGHHWDDSKINLFWLLASEHGVLEPNKKKIEMITNLSEAGIP